MKLPTLLLATLASLLLGGCASVSPLEVPERAYVSPYPIGFSPYCAENRGGQPGPIATLPRPAQQSSIPLSLAEELWIIPVASTSDKTPSPCWIGQLLLDNDPQVVHESSSQITAAIVGPMAELTVTQKFAASNSPRNATYLLPLDPAATPVDVVITTGKRTIRAIVRERATAKKIYDAAKAQGLPAYLARADGLFSLALGNIPAREEITTNVTCVQWVRTVGSDFVFNLPDFHHAPAANLRRTVVSLNTGLPPESVTCSHHLEQSGPTSYFAWVEPGGAKPFSLRYSLAAATPRVLEIVAPKSGVFAMCLCAPKTGPGKWLVDRTGSKSQELAPAVVGQPALLSGQTVRPEVAWVEPGKDPVLVKPIEAGSSPNLVALFARAKYDTLASQTSTQDRLKLALDFGLLTPETALLAIDTAP